MTTDFGAGASRTGGTAVGCSSSCCCTTAEVVVGGGGATRVAGGGGGVAAVGVGNGVATVGVGRGAGGGGGGGGGGGVGTAVLGASVDSEVDVVTGGNCAGGGADVAVVSTGGVVVVSDGGEVVVSADVVVVSDGEVVVDSDGEVVVDSDEVLVSDDVEDDVGVSSTTTGTSGKTGGGTPGGTVAAASCASTFTVSSCHWVTRSCLRSSSLTVATVVVSVCSLSCASCHCPWSISCCTAAIWVWAASTTASSRAAAGCSPKIIVRRPYSESPGPAPATTLAKPPRQSTAAAVDPTSASVLRVRLAGHLRVLQGHHRVAGCQRRAQRSIADVVAPARHQVGQFGFAVVGRVHRLLEGERVEEPVGAVDLVERRIPAV